MKTKEFIRLVEKLGYNVFQFEKNLRVFDSLTCRGIASISKEREMDLDINTDFYVLANLCVEYAKTPIEEREDEKLYTVQIPDTLKKGQRIFALGKLQENQDEVIIQKVKLETLNCDRCKLTESEIKRNHSYLWQFAKEVE